MAERKAFLLRLDPALLEDLQRWAPGRPAQPERPIEFLLRRALADAGRRREDDAPRGRRTPR